MTIHDTNYEFYTWQQLGEDIFSLSQRMIEAEMQFDRIVALAKGGVTFSRSVVDYLQIPNMSSIQIEFYSGINETNRTPVITQSLPVSIKNEKVLIFDDIADSGETLELAKKISPIPRSKITSYCYPVYKATLNHHSRFLHPRNICLGHLSK